MAGLTANLLRGSGVADTSVSRPQLVESRLLDYGRCCKAHCQSYIADLSESQHIASLDGLDVIQISES